MPGSKDRSPAETGSPDCRQGLQVSQSLRELFPQWLTGGRSKNSRRPFGLPTERLVFGIEGLVCRTPLVFSPLVESVGHRPLQAVDLSFQSRVLGDIPLLCSRFFRRFSSWMPAGIISRGSPRGRHLAIQAARAFRTAPEKFSTHVSIAILLCNSRSNGIWYSKWVWKLAQSMRLKSERSGGCWNDERHAHSMINGRCSEHSSVHEVIYTGNGCSFAITIFKKSGVAERLNGLLVGVSGPKIREELSSAKSRRSFPSFVFSRDSQSTCLALRSQANKTGNPPPLAETGVRSAPSSGWEGERYAAMIFNDLRANLTWRAVPLK